MQVGLFNYVPSLCQKETTDAMRDKVVVEDDRMKMLILNGSIIECHMTLYKFFLSKLFRHCRMIHFTNDRSLNF